MRSRRSIMALRWVGCFVKIINKWAVIGPTSLSRARLNYMVSNKACGYKKEQFTLKASRKMICVTLCAVGLIVCKRITADNTS